MTAGRAGIEARRQSRRLTRIGHYGGKTNVGGHPQTGIGLRPSYKSWEVLPAQPVDATPYNQLI
jgi:hypothetical protein